MLPKYDNHTNLIMEIRNCLYIIEELTDNITHEDKDLILEHLRIVNLKLMELSHTHNSFKEFLPHFSSPARL
ncbi:MAG: hypothetical protein FH756_20505 [Firmicutes bacterium]|nr:hypothetical protein [Bacillota bacterium]